ncbi:heparan-alpha-glucosaminide N-acetyltransferase domain-containing protein [Sphingomonas sp. A2-49]|uniref:DUF1624 domain-containing protein n=1 Tax=Sphingomonas sp. A2-49 TaxID=1391375 RepID=UPI0021D00B61|nr:heparan-alpha-glucosaminide N-acetyltransferase domain-containing protein [Sphingomonas sp. A2-49]MCU6454701.1 heparan-alpha-glucosaminide N-acetyltransferase domain-containing protein [Sphingomonas sp. A2-49]
MTRVQPAITMPSGATSAAAMPPGARIASIDGLRGLVMLLMLVDHTRETFFIGHQVADPMDLTTTPPGLVFTRLAAHLCAPIFVALTGIAAWLYGQGRPAAATAGFLLRRGLFLIVLEVTVVGFGWSFVLPPPMVFLQVIWAIGWSMISLAALVHLPRGWIAAIGAAIVIGHNALDPIAFAAGSPGHVPWAILHDRGIIDLWPGTRARTSYPLLPWIGVIALGHAIGPWFAARRARRLALLGIALLAACCVLRGINGYGDPTPWRIGPTALATVMGFLNLTKYPPSLDFLLLTLGVGALLLAAWPARGGRWLSVLGGAPLFFYVLHIYALHLLRLATARFGEVPSVGWLWLIAAAMTPPLWLATRWFAARKRTSRRWWMRYL